MSEKAEKGKNPNFLMKVIVGLFIIMFFVFIFLYLVAQGLLSFNFSLGGS